MKKEIKDIVVKALQDEKYNQCYGRLRDSEHNCFCVLGVICNLHSKVTGNEWNRNSYLGQAHVLPQEVVDWCGISKTDHTLLAIYNDNRVPFTSLAEIINNMGL